MVETQEELKEYFQYTVNETDQWSEELKKKYGIKSISLVMVCNLDHVYCCEITPSYEFEVIRYAVVTEDPDNYEDACEAIDDGGSLCSEEIRYYHCGGIKKEDLHGLGEFESLEDAIEEAQANWID